MAINRPRALDAQSVTTIFAAVHAVFQPIKWTVVHSAINPIFTAIRPILKPIEWPAVIRECR
ncbi:hypothetical protein KIN_28330 [Litoreibacter roseus]|uniref:Uncharacterized protein n=1 Tax=Litoreibacter roseus TaxID=2601869 RepID=A0A6N6JJZ3_9RHOB|nr:hypothetical protein KIN_28330 [Litoreibacter roseus]